MLNFVPNIVVLEYLKVSVIMPSTFKTARIQGACVIGLVALRSTVRHPF
jgi:hypothetical protein